MDTLLQTAVGHHRAGRFAQAEAAYRQALERQPAQAETLHLLGLLYLENGRPDAAAELIARAVGYEPHFPDYRHHLGLALVGQGRLADAEEQFRRAVELRPEFAGAHNDLGNVLKERGKAAEAEHHYRKTLALDPSHAAAHNNLGVILAAGGKLDEAIVCYGRAIELDPRDADTHLNLGNALWALRRPDEAVASYRKAIAGRPELVEAHLGLGASLQECGRLDDAIASYTDALAIDPQSVDGHNKLGAALREAGKPEAAIAHFRAALEADPVRADIHNNLGTALWELGSLPEAVAALQRAVALKPDDAEAHNNLSVPLCGLGRLADAEAVLQKALALRPQHSNAHLNLGHVLTARGRIEEAIAAYRRALTFDPTLDRAYSNLLLVLHYRPAMDAVEMRREHERWAERYALPLARHVAAHANDRAATRRLRIGYLSPDFCAHSVAAFIEPVLAAHDREAFEVTCYANVRRPDAVTARLRALGHRWRDIAFASDAEVAAQVRDDRIDILVDLAGHTAGNRLLVLACKPAPIQVAYLGYPDTWGFDAMDYSLTDALTDPPGAERSYVERLVRLPRGSSCYRPPADSPLVGPLPARVSGHLTLGSFNYIAKVNAEVIACWAKILTALPDARLILKAWCLTDADTRGRIMSLFAEKGVSPERLELIGWVPGTAAHLELYDRVDIALDPFPYNGHTTTCEALWMGVPVVTLAGRTRAGRVGVSLLTQMGLTELIAESVDDYVGCAVQLGRDLPRLAELRRTLRERMQRSSLTDASTFTRGLEDAYRAMWQRWCEQQSLLAVNPASASQGRGVEALSVAIRGGVSVVVPHSLQLLTPYVLLEQEDWFEDEIDFVRRFLQPGMRVIDIGASYGVYTLSMAKSVGPEGKVWAFEPAPEPGAFLEKGVEKNGFKNVVLYRMALSNRNGQARLKVAANTEMSTLAGADDRRMDHEPVTVRTLDSFLPAAGLQGIDFVKMDAEGEESRILEAAREFLLHESPLILFELKHGAELNLRLLSQFPDNGYRLYRLVPGLGVLVPFDAETPLDPYQLNLFACKPDRARMLEERGLLVETTVDVPESRLAVQESWAVLLGSFAYAQTLLESWRDEGRARRLPDADSYRQALDHYSHAHAPDVVPALRYYHLKRAFAMLSEVAESGGSLCRWQSLARVAWELAERATAVENLNRSLARLQTESTVVLEEPFLAVSRRFESLDPGAKVAEWWIASMLEQREKLRLFSSYFAEPTALATLETLEGLGFYGPEMERRRQLMRLRHRMQSYPEPHPLLAAETEENRNPAFWMRKR